MVRTKRRLEIIDGIKAALAEDIAFDADFHGWTQNEIAALTGLSQSDVSVLLRGQKLSRFTIDRLLMILIVFGHKPIISMG